MMFTGFSVPVRVRGRLNASPPQSERPVHAEQRVADALLVEVSVQKLVLQRAQLRGVGLRAHRRARVPEPVRRADGHRQIHGGQHAQNTGDHQSRGVPVIHHRASRSAQTRRDVFACPIFRPSASLHLSA